MNKLKTYLLAGIFGLALAYGGITIAVNYDWETTIDPVSGIVTPPILYLDKDKGISMVIEGNDIKLVSENGNVISSSTLKTNLIQSIDLNGDITLDVEGAGRVRLDNLDVGGSGGSELVNIYAGNLLVNGGLVLADQGFGGNLASSTFIYSTDDSANRQEVLELITVDGADSYLKLTNSVSSNNLVLSVGGVGGDIEIANGFLVSDSVSITGDLTYKAPVDDASGETVEISGDDSNVTFINDSDVASLDLPPTLPVGMIISVAVTSNNQFTINAGTGNTIYIGTTTSTVAGSFHCALKGCAVRLKAVDASTMMAESFVGPWDKT